MAVTTASPPSLLPRPSQAHRAIGWAGLLAGSLDITAAFVEAGLKGRWPVSVLQGIAGGLLGMSSFRGGLATVALGAVFHFLIATTAAAVFYLASRKLKFLGKAGHSIRTAVRRCGLHMYYYFVLPIAAYHKKIAPRTMSRLIRDVAIHMFMVGLPISLVVRKWTSQYFSEGRTGAFTAGSLLDTLTATLKLNA